MYFNGFLVTLFQNYLIIFEFFEYHLECRIEIAIIWDISELSIQFTGKIIAKKEVSVSQDFRGVFFCLLYFMYKIDPRTIWDFRYITLIV